MPHVQTYFFAAQLQHFTGWNKSDAPDPSKPLLINPITTYPAISHMEMGFPAPPRQCPTVRLIKKLWSSIKRRLGINGFLTSTPIWQNRFYTELAKLSGHSRWEAAGVKYLHQIFDDLGLKSYNKLKEKFPLFNTSIFSEVMQLDLRAAARPCAW